MNTLRSRLAAPDDYAARVCRGYRLANLPSLLAQLRQKGRYDDAEGDLAITTGHLGLFDAREAEQQLLAAVKARSGGDWAFRLTFDHPQRGLSHGLNPYTDWALSWLERRPRHTHLFLGLDFYSVADLPQDIGWKMYLRDPFGGKWDPYWHRVWAWIMESMRIGREGKRIWTQTMVATEAGAFIREDGGAFIFHNLIPYLRPVGLASTGGKWPGQELQKQSVRKCIVADLRLLRETAVGPITTYCTKKDTVELLLDAGFAGDSIVCWGAHPSWHYRFNPTSLYDRRGIHFLRVR